MKFTFTKKDIKKAREICLECSDLGGSGFCKELRTDVLVTKFHKCPKLLAIEDCKRGGRREGSGRKASVIPKTTISFRVSAETKQLIQAARRTGIDTNAILARVAEKIEAEKEHLSNAY